MHILTILDIHALYKYHIAVQIELHNKKCENVEYSDSLAGAILALLPCWATFLVGNEICVVFLLYAVVDSSIAKGRDEWPGDLQ